MIGSILNKRYRIDSELGQGGMGTVFRGYDTVIERDVAVKVISSTTLGTNGVEKLLHEARAAGKLNHPQIVSVFDAGEVDGAPFIVMELVQGKLLGEVPKLSLEETIHITLQICEALQHAHSNGIIHRDLKPENVMVSLTTTHAFGTGPGQLPFQGDGKWVVKLMDFGVAQSLGESPLATEGDFVGTLSYLAPEMALGQEATPQSDLYALGVILYELLTGRLPFSGDDPLALISQHIHAPVVPPTTYNPDVPPNMESVILKLLEKSPDARYRSALDLSNVLAGLDTLKPGTPPIPEQTLLEEPPPSSRLRLLDRMVRGRLIGRAEELTELQSFWDRAAQGGGHLVLLSGEPGIGKTRLAREFGVYTRLRGAQVLAGGYQPELDLTYFGIREALRTYLRSLPEDQAREEVQPFAGELIKLLPELHEIVGEVNPNPPIDGLDEERLRLFDHLTRFLKRIAEKAPILLILEDLHWADSPSLDFLHFLLRNMDRGRILVLGTYREVGLDPARPFYEKLLGLNRERLYTRIALRRLDNENIGKMISVLLDGQVDDDLVRQIFHETEGNPFFVEEVVKSLLSRGALQLNAGIWSQAEGLVLQVPQSVQIAVGKRISELTDDARDVLRRAAVLGRAFSVDVLIQMTGWDEDRLLDALEEAEDAQVIVEARGDPQEDYHFEHALISQVMYEGISLRRRERIHQRAAEAIEKVVTRKLDDYIEPLAYHYALSPSRAAEKAIAYGLQAAERAVGVYAHEQAVRYYMGVLESLEDLNDHEREAEVWELLGDTQNKLNFRRDAVEAYESALTTLENGGMAGSLAYCRLSYKLAEMVVGDDSTRARQLLETALANPALQENSPLQADCMTQMVFSLLGDQEIARAHKLAEVALRIAEDTGDHKSIANAWGALAHVHNLREDQISYASAAEKQITALEACDDYFGVFGAFFESTQYFLLGGNFKSAEELASEGLQFCRRTNAPGWEGTVLANYLFILSAQGRWSEARSHAKRVLPLFHRAGGKPCFLYIFLYLAQIEAYMGNNEQAQHYIENMVDILLQLEGIDSNSNNYLVWRFLGFAYTNQWEEAWKIVEEARAREFIPRPVYSGFFWWMKAPEAAARTGHFKEAEKLALEFLEGMKEARINLGLAPGFFGLGLGLAGQGRGEEALEAYQKALFHFRELQQTFDIGKTLYELGRLFAARKVLGDRKAAKGSFDEALQIFEDLGAGPSAEMVRDALADSSK